MRSGDRLSRCPVCLRNAARSVVKGEVREQTGADDGPEAVLFLTNDFARSHHWNASVASKKQFLLRGVIVEALRGSAETRDGVSVFGGIVRRSVLAEAAISKDLRLFDEMPEDAAIPASADMDLLLSESICVASVVRVLKEAGLEVVSDAITQLRASQYTGCEVARFTVAPKVDLWGPRVSVQLDCVKPLPRFVLTPFFSCNFLVSDGRGRLGLLPTFHEFWGEYNPAKDSRRSLTGTCEDFELASVLRELRAKCTFVTLLAIDNVPESNLKLWWQLRKKELEQKEGRGEETRHFLRSLTLAESPSEVAVPIQRREWIDGVAWQDTGCASSKGTENNRVIAEWVYAKVYLANFLKRLVKMFVPNRWEFVNATCNLHRSRNPLEFYYDDTTSSGFPLGDGDDTFNFVFPKCKHAICSFCPTTNCYRQGSCVNLSTRSTSDDLRTSTIEVLAHCTKCQFPPTVIITVRPFC